MSELEHTVLNGVELAWRIDGSRSAPPLVLVNSLGTTTELWGPQLPALSSEFCVVRFDLRGHGGSAATPGPYQIEQLGDDLIALLDLLGIERASLCGLSIGGMIAMSVASRRPERVDRLVLACTAPALPPASAWRERAAAVRAGGLGQLAQSLFERWFTPAFRTDHPETIAGVAAMLSSCDPEGYAACCEAIAEMDQRQALGAIRAPTLVLTGAEDPVATPQGSLELATAIPGASLVVLADAAHLANLGQPERFTEAVRAQLRGSARERGMAVRRAVLGDAHVERASAAARTFGASFQELITAYAWGEVWGRPGLDRRTRSAITLAMLSALGRHEELTFHVPAALTNGLTEDEIEEILLQSAIYGGVPAANRAFAVAREVLEKGAR